MNNYFKIINRFFDEAPDLDGYKTDHPALFYAIVDSINRNGWRDTEIEYDRIINKVKLGKANYLKARDWLRDNQFIRYVPGRGDYQKAKFGLGGAVLGKTANDPANGTSAVPPNTAPDTASNTANGAGAVLPETADDTAPSTASGTAGDTHLIGRHITDYILPSNQQQHQQGDSPDSESDDGGDDGRTDDSVGPPSGFQKKIGAPPEKPSPHPLPTDGPAKPPKVPINGREFRDAIRPNRLAYEHAIRLKLATDESAFQDLIDVFLGYQAGRQEAENPDINSVDDVTFTCLADAKKHFLNWMNTRDVHAATPNKSTNGSQRTNQRGKGTLRPTSLGQPNYRGEGSTCDVDI